MPKLRTSTVAVNWHARLFFKSTGLSISAASLGVSIVVYRLINMYTSILGTQLIHMCICDQYRVHGWHRGEWISTYSQITPKSWRPLTQFQRVLTVLKLPPVSYTLMCSWVIFFVLCAVLPIEVIGNQLHYSVYGKQCGIEIKAERHNKRKWIPPCILHVPEWKSSDHFASFVLQLLEF